MFLTLINGELLNITKVSTISFDADTFTITYGVINGKAKKEIMADEPSYNSRVEFIKSKLIMK